MNHHGTMAFLRAALSHQRSIRLDLRQGRPAGHRQQRRNGRARRHHGGVPDRRRLRAGQLLASGRCPAGQEGPALRRPQRHRRRDLVALLLPRTQVRPRLQSRTDRQAQRRLRRHPRHHPIRRESQPRPRLRHRDDCSRRTDTGHLVNLILLDCGLSMRGCRHPRRGCGR